MESQGSPSWLQKLPEFLRYLRSLFDLQEGKEEDLETIEEIKKNIEFKGANLYILIFAILVASVGLNVNSTAVVIGAMLISPIMGPIMGIGLAAGINDFELLKKSLKNLGIAALISILTSAIYFLFTPLDSPQSELLARTEPSIWDVLIAFFGGLAGIVAGSRKEKSNAIPGVAIATALMPPLCTAGFGVATGNFSFFLGAFYLFFINSVFISLSTYLIVRFMKFPKKVFLDTQKEKQVVNYITLFIILTVAPSIYLAYNIVTRTLWQQNAERFLKVELDFNSTEIISSQLHYQKDSSLIEVVMIGERLSTDLIQQLNKKVPLYGLKNTHLKIQQRGDSAPDLNVLKSDVLKDLYERNEIKLVEKEEEINRLKKQINELSLTENQSKDIAKELSIMYPQLKSLALSRAQEIKIGSNEQETFILCQLHFEEAPDKTDISKINNWLKTRLKEDKVQLVVD
ncbi:MAG: hypothetical protein RJA52_890 [Bacteroidota bacterium]